MTGAGSLQAIAFVVLAGAGAAVRAVLGDRLNGRPPRGAPELDLPWGTLGANLAASFVLAVLVGRDVGSAAVTVGGLGALSTWSTFAVEVIELLGAGRRWAALGYGMLTLGGAVGAAWVGLQLP
ncbi:MAG: fluoride efflux transporter FluC [Acidimicrobiales bacterium]